MVTYEELVEKVARDLAADMVNLGIQPDSLIADSEGMMAPLWMSFVAPAKAVIATIHEALSEPSEEMIAASKAVPIHGSSDVMGDALEDDDILRIIASALAAGPLVEEGRR